MTPRREILAFSAVLAALLGLFFAESLVGGKVLSPADVVYAQASFREFRRASYEPANRLLIDPVLQFQPWLEFNRTMLRSGRLPLWNGLVGCGAPHLANGQSAVFDPFHAIAYLGELPTAHAWMAAARLWVAGLGMFLLAGRWRLGAWGRWFAGLTFPFCGFLVVWLLFPVTGAALWMPWLFWATDRAWERPGARTIGLLALVVGCLLLAGHIQTSAHVMLADAAYVTWLLLRRSGDGTANDRWRRAAAWGAGMTLGIALAAIEVVPLACYLARSPVWLDRAAARPSAWALPAPRLMDAACTALPYLYGSQRRGHPNLAKALGVHNLNESAGGYAGLATLLWLAPLGMLGMRESPRAGFLGGLTLCGALGAFTVPPVSNALRLLPVLDVMDHRRLTLWVAFGLVLLGGMGLDRLERACRGRAWGRWMAAWALAALALFAVAMTVGRLEPRLKARALDHYRQAAARDTETDPAVLRARALAQVQKTLTFVPCYASLCGAELCALAAVGLLLRRGRVGPAAARPALLGLTLLELFGFGFGLNPAIDPRDDRPVSSVIAYLQRETPPPARVVGVGAELPPNVLMRYGLADIRNYDSVELRRAAEGFGRLYEPSRERTSRREITWDGVIRSLETLRGAGVRAVVGATPPPRGAFARVDRVGAAWIARIDGPPILAATTGHGRLSIRFDEPRTGVIPIAETFDPGWKATADGVPAEVRPHGGMFLGVVVPAPSRRVDLRYDPPEVRAALAISVAALALIAGSLILGRGRPPAEEKSVLRSWMASGRRVRIGSAISSGLSSQPSH